MLNQEYLDFKKNAIENQPLQKKVSLKEINITEKGSLVIQGIEVRANASVMAKILKLLQINPTFINKFGQITSEKAKYQIIELMKMGLEALNNDKNSEKYMLTFIVNPTSKEISDVIYGNFDLIPNEMALQLFERTMESDKELEIVNMSTGTNGHLALIARKNTIVEATSKGSLIVGEEFNPGFKFENNLEKGLTVSSYVERLVCSNGMVSQKYFGDVSIKQVNADSVKEFFKKFIVLKDNRFVPAGYGENISRALETRASFYELMYVKDAFINYSKIQEKDLSNYLPEWLREVNKMAALGFDYSRCTDQQLKNYPISVDIWKIINRLTDFGSHDYGFNADFVRLQEIAGSILNKKTFDTDNLLIYRG